MTDVQTSAVDERPTWRSLLFGLVIWFLHQNLLYILTSNTCQWGWFPYQIAGMSGLHFFQLVITVVAAVLLAITIYRPWQIWRRFQTSRPTNNEHMLQDTEKDRRPLIAFVTMSLNAFFLLFVVTTLVPMFAINPCG